MSWTSSLCRTSVFARLTLLALFLLAVPSSTQAQNPIPVRWGTTLSIELATPLYVAISQGYFAQEGLKVENVLLGPGIRLREAMAAGELDFAENTTTTLIVGRQAGLKQKVVFEYYTKEIFSLLVPKKLENDIKNITDLKGKKIAVPALGTGAHMAALAFVRKGGLKETDVTFVGLNSADPAVLLTAFNSGQFDAQIFWEPTSSLLLERNAAVPLVDIRDPQAHKKFVGDAITSEVLWVSEDMIAKRPEVVERAVRALRKALLFIREKSASEVANAIAPSFKMETAALTKILEPLKANFSIDGRISRSGVQGAVELARGGGIVKQNLTYEELVEPRFVGSRD